MKKNEALSLTLFALSFVLWIGTLFEMGQHPEWCLDNIPSNVLLMVSALWSLSNIAKIWIVTAILSSVVLWCCGGFFAIGCFFVSFIIPVIIPVEDISIFDMIGMSLSVWAFILLMDGAVVILWHIKEWLKEKKEVSHQM